MTGRSTDPGTAPAGERVQRAERGAGVEAP
jgi:hypothetical protein